MDEKELLAALRRRDSDAFTILFETYSDKVYRLAVGLLENEAEAEGVVQDSFLRLFERLDQFEGRSKISTWLFFPTCKSVNPSAKYNVEGEFFLKKSISSKKKPSTL